MVGWGWMVFGLFDGKARRYARIVEGLMRAQVQAALKADFRNFHRLTRAIAITMGAADKEDVGPDVAQRLSRSGWLGQYQSPEVQELLSASEEVAVKLCGPLTVELPEPAELDKELEALMVAV